MIASRICRDLVLAAAIFVLRLPGQAPLTPSTIREMERVSRGSRTNTSALAARMAHSSQKHIRPENTPPVTRRGSSLSPPSTKQSSAPKPSK